MPRKPVERKPMKERIGWAVVNAYGWIMVVSPRQKQEVIREFVDPAYEMYEKDRKAAWKELLKDGYSVVKVRISAV